MSASSLRMSAMQVRSLMTSAVRRSGDAGGVPGSGLPFSINNRYKLSAYFILFFGSGFAAPFLLVRHQLLKK